MDYLAHVLGIDVVYSDDPPKLMPNYIDARYHPRKVLLDHQEAVFLYPKTELDDIVSVRKHIARIRSVEDTPVILVPEHLTYRQKEYLLRNRIPFIVEGRQIYLPFFATYIQARNDAEKNQPEGLLPSAQLLLLHYIYHGSEDLLTSEAAKRLGFSPMSISRASRQLADLGLIRVEKRGIQKAILTDQSPQELFQTAASYLRNPVRRKIYVSKADLDKELLLSGYSALSEYSMLNPPHVAVYAADSVVRWEKKSSKTLQNSEDQCAVELWRYDPKILSEGDSVDRLSLALALRDDSDERTEEAISDMLSNVWSEINGKRT